jgi:hypothetical protein
MRGRVAKIGVAIAAACVLAWMAATAGAVSTTTSTQYTGSTSDGGTWIADVPSPWNGTLLLYSHGFGPPVAADAPDPATKTALLNRGYALAGSSYDPNGPFWALGSALRDQFETLQAVKQTVLPSAPNEVLAFGTSMGGLISALEDENSNGRLDGALTTCGLVGGGIKLNNYQLDQEYAMARLLAPGQPIKLVRFNNPGEAISSATQLSLLAQTAQTTPQGRARLALSMAFGNVATWDASHPTPPPVNDYGLQEQEQYSVEFTPPVGFNALTFVEFGRADIERASGGNGSWTAGVDFARLLDGSPYLPQVQALYREAGLDLKSDVADLTANANIQADANAIEWLRQTSVPTGELQVPELNLHTISDQLIPVQQETAYAEFVRKAGESSLLRQAFVQRVGHCNFTPAELVAGVQAVQHRVQTGRWDSVAQADKLSASAAALGLGGSAFVEYQPSKLTADNEDPVQGR